MAAATPDHDAVLTAAAEVAAAVDAALAAAPRAPVDPSAVAGLAAALGVPVPGRLRWEPPSGCVRRGEVGREVVGGGRSARADPPSFLAARSPWPAPRPPAPRA